MNYFRSDEKIYTEKELKVVDEEKDLYETLKGVPVKVTFKSEDIEELIDAGIAVIGTGIHIFIPNDSEYGSNLTENIKDSYRKLYGGIWTDKGLIYVVKLNDEREWELI